MIKGKAKMEFGTGDIRMTGALSGGIGALCCITQEPHEIGEKIPVEDTWDTEQAEVVLTFTKTESGNGDSEAIRALLEAIFNWMRNGGLYKLLIDVLTNGVEFEFDNREIARLVKKYA